MALPTGRFEDATTQSHRAERRCSPDLAAYHWNGSSPRLTPVRDISASGAFLLTPDRWQPGETISITLQRNGPFEKSPEHRIAVQARLVRWDDHGVAVSFVLPAGAELRLWQSPLKSAAEQTAPEDILREFKVAQCISLLSRIVPEGNSGLKKLLHEELSNYRLERAIEITLQAEKMLGYRPGAANLRASASVIEKIIVNGSWAEDPVIIQFFAGLMVSSCSDSTEADSSMKFVDILTQLNSAHVRILTGVTAKSQKMVTGPNRISTRPIVCSTPELTRITGTHDLIRIERDLEHLSEIGLIAPRDKSTFFSAISDTRITITHLGLEFYARCNGHRGTQGFYGLTPPATPVLTTE